MSPLAILLRKELHANFTSPIAYSIAGVFLLVLGYTFSLTLFTTKVANLNYIFHQVYVLSILLVPALTMRAFAEERRTDTLERDPRRLNRKAGDSRRSNFLIQDAGWGWGPASDGKTLFTGPTGSGCRFGNSGAVVPGDGGAVWGKRGQRGEVVAALAADG